MTQASTLKKLMGLGSDARSTRGIFSRGNNIYNNGTQAAKTGPQGGRMARDYSLDDLRTWRPNAHSLTEMSKARSRRNQAPDFIVAQGQRNKQARASRAAIARRLSTKRVK